MHRLPAETPRSSLAVPARRAAYPRSAALLAAALLVAAILVDAVPLPAAARAQAAERRFDVHGMVLDVRPESRVFYVSHDRIAGLMDSMTMPFEVRDARDLDPLAPGAVVDFTLVLASTGAYATGIRVGTGPVPPVGDQAGGPTLGPRVRVAPASAARHGALVPDVPLTDDAGQPFRFSGLAGKVTAVGFVYTRCPEPARCARADLDFAPLQERFRQELGRDLVFVTATVDPGRDTPAVLAGYAASRRRSPDVWRFVTGPVPEVRRVLAFFGAAEPGPNRAAPSSVHTAVVDRAGRLVATVEDTRYRPEQLGDLILTALTRER